MSRRIKAPQGPQVEKRKNRPFQMPAAQTMTSRKSSITNAFVSAVIPLIPPTEEEVAEVLALLQIDPNNVSCAYCGDPSSEWDHLRPLVVNRRPTGFISEIANLVPSCGKCNQSKGNKDWKTWMLSGAKHSPTKKGKLDVQDRIARLHQFEQWRIPLRVDFTSIVGEAAWQHYWDECEKVINDLKSCQHFADAIKDRIIAALQQTPKLVVKNGDARDVIAPASDLQNLVKDSTDVSPTG